MTDAILERIENLPVPEMLRRLRQEKSSGTVVATRNRRECRISLVEGEVVLAQSSAPGHRLGEYLVTQQLLSSDDLEKYLKEFQKDRPFGLFLVSRGVVGRPALLSNLQRLVTEIISDVFGWDQGSIAFEPNVHTVEQDRFIDLEAKDLLYKASQSVENLDVLQRTVRACGEPLLWATDEVRERVPLKLTPAEYYALSRLEGHPVTIDEAMKVIGDRLLACRTLVGLLLVGWLTPPGEKDPRRFIGLDDQTRKLEELVEKMDEMSFYEMLRIPPGASQTEIKKKYEVLLERYRRVDGNAEYRYYRRKLIERLHEVFAVLGNPVRRKQYDAASVRSGRGLSAEGVQREELMASIADTNYEKAKYLYDEEDYYGAIRLMEQSIRFDSKNVGYIWLLARCLMKNPRWAKRTVSTLEQVIRLDPSHVEAHIELGNLYLAQKMFRRAMSAFKNAIALDAINERAIQGLKRASASDPSPV